MNKKILISLALLGLAIGVYFAIEAQPQLPFNDRVPRGFARIHMLNRGVIRFHETQANGVNYGEMLGDAAIASNYQFSPPSVLATGAAGLTVNSTGKIGPTWYSVTVPRTVINAAAVTQDITLAVIPAKTVIHRVIADVTQAFACTAVCTSSTLSATTGKTAGGNEYLLSYDADLAAAVFGDAIAEMGASLTAATTPVSSGVGDIPSWSANTNLTMRFTSGTGNLGDGTVSNLSAGSITFYILANRLP